jgi:hypothetical protein
MREFLPQQRRRSMPDLFVRMWRRWVAVRADQLLEIARLGSDKLDYLTNNPNPEFCTVADADDLLPRRMLAFDVDPYDMAHSDPALLRHLERCCARCGSPGDCASDLARASDRSSLARSGRLAGLL